MGLIAEINRIGYYVREVRIVNDAGHRVAGFGTAVFSGSTGGRSVTLPRSTLRASGYARTLFRKPLLRRGQCLEPHVSEWLKPSGLRSPKSPPIVGTFCVLCVLLAFKYDAERHIADGQPAYRGQVWDC
jgi:hypothetical protein